VPVFVSRRDRVRTVALAVAVLAVFLGGVLVVQAYAPFLTSAAGIRGFVRGFGPWAPLAFVGLQTVQVVVAPIPGQVTAVIGGFLFGPLWGTVYSVAGGSVAGTSSASSRPRRSRTSTPPSSATACGCSSWPF
jgi:uncharacterized membrane protein YdjX (TVP38/TMEM64 family)